MTYGLTLFFKKNPYPEKYGVHPLSGMFLPLKYRFFTVEEASWASGIEQEALHDAISRGYLLAERIPAYRRKYPRWRWKIMAVDFHRFLETHLAWAGRRVKKLRVESA